MKLKEIKIKLGETIKTREYENIKPEIELTYEVDESVDPQALERAIQDAHSKYEAVKETAMIAAGGKKVQSRERWVFDKHKRDADLLY